MKNIWCPHYKTCLDLRSKRDVQWICDHCAYNETYEPPTRDQLLQDIEGSRALLWQLFRGTLDSRIPY